MPRRSSARVPVARQGAYVRGGRMYIRSDWRMTAAAMLTERLRGRWAELAVAWARLRLQMAHDPRVDVGLLRQHHLL